MLANSKVVCIMNMPCIFTFHISHPLEVFYDNWSLLKAVSNALTSYIKFCDYVMLNSNEPIKNAHLQKLANQSVLGGALLIEIVNNSFTENKKIFLSFDKERSA